MGEEDGTKAIEIVSKFFIKDYLLGSLSERIRPILYMINDIVKVSDSEFYNNLMKIGVNFPVY